MDAGEKSRNKFFTFLIISTVIFLIVYIFLIKQEASLRLKEFSANHYTVRGCDAVDDNNYGRAIEDFSISITIDPSDSFIYLLLGCCLYHEDRYKEAKETLEEFLKFDNISLKNRDRAKKILKKIKMKGLKNGS